MRGWGRLVMALALTTAIYIPTVAQQTAQAACGVWRWPVKTLSDPARTKVNFTAVGIGVRRLRRLTPPSILSTDTPRLKGVERRTYAVKAQVVEAKFEDDSDIHLVIASRTRRTRTMIVEFPKPTCVASSFKRARMA